MEGTNLYMQPDIIRERCRWWRGHRIPIPFLFPIIAIILHFYLFSEANLGGARCERDGTGGVPLGVASKSREWTRPWPSCTLQRWVRCRGQTAGRAHLPREVMRDKI